MRILYICYIRLHGQPPDEGMTIPGMFYSSVYDNLVDSNAINPHPTSQSHVATCHSEVLASCVATSYSRQMRVTRALLHPETPVGTWLVRE